ncbi:hypothetical protein AVEN_192135-1 [Araneus ventricosus]|uniref:Uncharacterized protein n=1 Tax=Araneus ventricosus TaxID=182803 RepID=A0A4Y2QSM8_ARAVE|nr:hypothetical protein AVEN_192135-1 [Araneus ventricosus]
MLLRLSTSNSSVVSSWSAPRRAHSRLSHPSPGPWIFPEHNLLLHWHFGFESFEGPQVQTQATASSMQRSRSSYVILSQADQSFQETYHDVKCGPSSTL